MKTYLLVVEKEFLRQLKVESAKVDKTMKEFIIEAVLEKINGKKKA